MAITTYALLQSEILKYLKRSNDSNAQSLTANWISLCESDVKKFLRGFSVTDGETVDDAFSLTSGVSVPSGCLFVKSLGINGDSGGQIAYLPMDKLMGLPYARTNGRPVFYTQAADTIITAPVADSAYECTIVYTKLDSLSDQNASNWLLLTSPEVYLYGALKQAAAYYRDVDGAAGYSSLYEAAKSKIKDSAQVGFNLTGLSIRPSGAIY